MNFAAMPYTTMQLMAIPSNCCAELNVAPKVATHSVAVRVSISGEAGMVQLGAN